MVIAARKNHSSRKTNARLVWAGLGCHVGSFFNWWHRRPLVMMCHSNAQMLVTSEAQEDTESSELFDLCRFCWGGGGQGHGHGHICQIWKLDELAWFSWEDTDLRGFVQGSLGGLDPQKKANGAGRDLVHSHLPRCPWRPWGNRFDRVRPPRALVKS